MLGLIHVFVEAQAPLAPARQLTPQADKETERARDIVYACARLGGCRLRRRALNRARGCAFWLSN